MSVRFPIGSRTVHLGIPKRSRRGKHADPGDTAKLVRYPKFTRSTRIAAAGAAVCGLGALTVTAVHGAGVAQAARRHPSSRATAAAADLLAGRAAGTTPAAANDLGSTELARMRALEVASRSMVRAQLDAQAARAARAARLRLAAQQAAAARAAQAARAAAATQAAAQAAAATVSAAVSNPQAAAQALAAQRGWGASQFSCLVSLWNKESGWNYRASNPYSGAYGIPQALPGSKMASAGSDWLTNPVTQIRWGLQYIAGSYGTPCGAWAHSQATGWY